VKPYQRFFGGGPIGLALSLVLLSVAFRLAPHIKIQAIHNNREIGDLSLVVSSILALALSIWSLVTLPPLSRGKKLVTTGAFKYLRHPLYTSFLLFFFGFAFWLDHWIFIIWAISVLPIWHLSVLGEEKLMRQNFPGAYEEYCRQTRRFIPGIW
jgi:protein-S-isoprenylcysteine O-methyltransferase Ste14